MLTQAMLMNKVHKAIGSAPDMQFIKTELQALDTDNPKIVLYTRDYQRHEQTWIITAALVVDPNAKLEEPEGGEGVEILKPLTPEQQAALAAIPPGDIKPIGFEDLAAKPAAGGFDPFAGEAPPDEEPFREDELDEGPDDKEEPEEEEEEDDEEEDEDEDAAEDE